MAERHARALAELTELGLAAARELGAAISEAATPGEKATLAAALHRVSRSVRQSIALEARLVRDAARHAQEAAAAAREDVKRRVDRRKAQVTAIIERAIWDEHEEDEAHRLEDLLYDRLDAEAAFDAFLTDPIEAQIASICETLGLSPPSLLGDALEAVEGGEGLVPRDSSPCENPGMAPARAWAGSG